MPVYRLGCASTYNAEIRFRGGGGLWTKIEGLTNLKWGRKRDDFSEASVTVTKANAGLDCCGRLGQTRTWGHELRIYRNSKPVWEGPIVKITEKRATLDIEARDLIAWFDRREIAHDYGGGTNPENTGTLIRTIISDAFPKGNAFLDPGIMAFAVLQDTPGRTTKPDIYWKESTTVGEVVRDLLGTGVLMCTVGRTIYVVSDRAQMAATPYRLGEQDFLTELEVIESGLDAATRGIVVGSQPDQTQSPKLGSADAPNPAPDFPVNFYGRITRFSSSSNVSDGATLTGIARAVVASGWPPPVDIQVPNGARLSPEAPVDLGQLVPGNPFTVLLDNYCRKVQQTFRLNELEVTWGDNEVEEISVSLSSNGPAELVTA